MAVTPESALQQWFEKPVEFWGFTLARVVDGQLVEGWNSFDFLAMYEQIGVRLNMPSAE